MSKSDTLWWLPNSPLQAKKKLRKKVPPYIKRVANLYEYG